MDTIGIEVPQDAKRVDRRLAAAVLAAGTLVALGGGYAIGAASDAPAQPATVIARGTPATWQDAVDEANAVKQHAAAAAAEQRLDVRMARVEE
jgi:hypothetical protein